MQLPGSDENENGNSEDTIVVLQEGRQGFEKAVAADLPRDGENGFLSQGHINHTLVPTCVA